MKHLNFNIVFAFFVCGLVASESSAEPPTNKYEAKNSNHNFCLLFQSAIRLDFKYEKADNATQFVSNSTDIPKLDSGTKFDGQCINDSTQSVILRFLDDWSLEFGFKMNATSTKYTMAYIRLIYQLSEGKLPFPDAKSTGRKVVQIQVDDEWCDKYGSYVCTGRRLYQPVNNASQPFVTMEMFNEQYNAFINSTSSDFTANVHRCNGDSISNLIPIVVGAALGGLIVIVLIAYIIGRHRSKKGYESV